MARRSGKRKTADGTMAPAAAAPNEDDCIRYLLTRLKSISHDDREKLEDFQLMLEEAIRKVGTGSRKRAQREEYIRLQGRVIERLETLDNQQNQTAVAQVTPAQVTPAQEISSKHKQRTSASDKQPTALLRSKRLKKSIDDHQIAQQLTGKIGPHVAGLPKADEGKVGEENASSNGAVVCYDNDDEVVSIKNQTQRATQQLDSFISLLHERLVNTKQRLYNFLSSEVYSYLTDEVASSLKDVQTAIVIGLALTDLQPALDEAILRTGTHQDTSDETNKIDLMMDDADEPDDKNLMKDVQTSPDKDMSLTEIQAAANESSCFRDIFKSLAQHRVKPHFHTLCLPETFLNNRRSPVQVTAGGVDNRALKFDQSGNNLVEVVAVDENGIGKGARSIIDRGMGSEGEWEFDRDHTAFAVELVNTEAVMLGQDIERTKLKSFPFKINPGDVSHLFTRPESRGVVRDIFYQFAENSNTEFVAAMTGLPGIGKSWTLFYALQQALRYNGATVLFYFQKRTFAVMYLRRGDKVYAWKSKSKDAADSYLFERSDVLVLLDPREADKGGAQYESGNAKLLYAASNNKSHISIDALKNSPNMLTFLGPPLDNELAVILRCLKPTLTKNVIEDRKASIGNLIRYILTGKQYENRLAAIEEAVDQCTGDPRLLEKALQVNAMSDAQQTISGTLFKILPKRPKDLGNIGYDGQEVEYRERVVEAANANVRSQILKASRKTILTYLGKTSYEEFAKMGNKART